MMFMIMVTADAPVLHSLDLMIIYLVSSQDPLGQKSLSD